jgi:hypothetical protein
LGLHARSCCERKPNGRTPVTGTTTGDVTTAILYTIPNNPALIGTQVSVQAAFGAVVGSLGNVGLPGYAVIVP